MSVRDRVFPPGTPYMAILADGRKICKPHSPADGWSALAPVMYRHRKREPHGWEPDGWTNSLCWLLHWEPHLDQIRIWRASGEHLRARPNDGPWEWVREDGTPAGLAINFCMAEAWTRVALRERWIREEPLLAKWFEGAPPLSELSYQPNAGDRRRSRNG